MQAQTDLKSSPIAEPGEAEVKGQRLNLLLRLWKDQPLAIIICFLFLFSGILGPVLAPYPPNKVSMPDRLQSVSLTHPFGTDEFGRDILSRIVAGSRIALLVVGLSIGIATILGILMGLIMGFYRGTIDYILSRVIDAFQAFPAVLLAIAIAAILGPSIETVVVALGIVYIPAVARVTRGAVLRVMAMDYVEAGRAMGASNRYIIFRTVLPNSISPLIIQLSYLAPQAILWESGLSFLGLGVRPPNASWGNMLNGAKAFMFSSPSYAIITGVIISAVILGVNMLGDSLRVVLDPQLRR